MKFTFHKTAAAVAIAASMALTACVDSTNFPTENPDPQTATIAGTAVKGTLANANVIVETLAGVLIMSTTTDSAGDFTVEVPAAGANTIYVVRIVATADTRMTCDTSTCDGEVADLTGLELSTIALGGAANQVTSANVNALTTMAASSLKEVIGDVDPALVTPENFAAAQAEVSETITTILDLPATNLFALDIADASQDSSVYEFANAAFGAGTPAEIVELVTNTATQFKKLAADPMDATAAAAVVTAVTTVAAEVTAYATEVEAPSVPVLDIPTVEEIEDTFEDIDVGDLGNTGGTGGTGGAGEGS
jgi:hypothetical protein